jgi:Ca2+-binding EF-hand superfamily protein
MLSEDTQNLLCRILISLAEGEHKVEDARKELSNQDFYALPLIFKTLDNNGDQRITPKDVQSYLLNHDLDANFKEIKMFLLFYDQDHDYVLTYGEIFKMIHPGKEFIKNPKLTNEEELPVKVDRKLFNLLEQEILLARTLISLLEEIKHKKDFNIHSAFHCLKYYACITGDSINLFLKKCGYKLSTGDINAIVKRLDINRDEIIDFCEFHAFMGFPDCKFCCPCFPCGNCGVKYCDNCLQDIPCYILGCDHYKCDSKLKCTSFEHNPGNGADPYESLLGIYKNSMIKDPNFISNFNNSFYDKNVNNQSNKFNNKNSDYNNDENTNRFMNKGNKGNLSPDQYNLLQGLTNPEQLNKFMKVSGILDQQNEEEINLTNNLFLRKSPVRDFDPKEWGCRNCPCNIHGNPNIPCDCCGCMICPNKQEEIVSKEKIKQRVFPKNSNFSYSYSYDI